MIINLEALIVYRLQDDLVSNDFMVKTSKCLVTNLVVSDCVADALILVYLNLSKIFSSLSSDAKGLSKKKDSMKPFESPWICPCIVFQS